MTATLPQLAPAAAVPSIVGPARPGLLARLLDAAEYRLWHDQDQALAGAGWQVTATGRWTRTYRHPAQLAAAIAAQGRPEWAPEGGAR
jgi:hypothetical protein